MNRFTNILYVSFSNGDQTASLSQAIELAAASGASLQVLVVYPQLPKTHESFKSSFEGVLLEKMEDSVQTLLDKLHQPQIHTVKISVEGAKAVANTIIKRVLREDHDLLIKEAESIRKGFKAIDMDLLRQCPCPLWLNRTAEGGERRRDIAVAIDPEDNSQSGQDLACRMLELSQSLAMNRGSKLTVISCWDFVYEDFLRHNAWTSTPDPELHKLVHGVQQEHKQALDKLIGRAGLSNKEVEVKHLRGEPDEIIPQIVLENSIEVLVMGTVARTGLPGFIIGNTAENIAHTLSCSLLAMKPAGFASPVKAYD